MNAARRLRKTSPAEDEHIASPPRSNTASSSRSTGSVSSRCGGGGSVGRGSTAPGRRPHGPVAPKLKLPGNASAGEQMAAIMAMRSRTKDVAGNIKNIQAKAKAGKEQSRSRGHKDHWLQERLALAKERRTAAEGLEEAHAVLMNHADMSMAATSGTTSSSASKKPRSDSSDSPQVLPSREEDASIDLQLKLAAHEYDHLKADTSDEATTVLTNILALKAKVGMHASRPDSRNAEEKEVMVALEGVKEYLKEEEMHLKKRWELLELEIQREETARAIKAELHADESSSSTSGGGSSLTAAGSSAASDVDTDAGQSVAAVSLSSFIASLDRERRHADAAALGSDAKTQFSVTTLATTMNAKTVQKNLEDLERHVDAESAQIPIDFPATVDEIRGVFGGAIMDKLCSCRDAVDGMLGSTQNINEIIVATVSGADRKEGTTPYLEGEDSSSSSQPPLDPPAAANIITSQNIARMCMLCRDYGGKRHGTINTTSGRTAGGAGVGGGRQRAALIDRITFEMPHITEGQAKQCCEIIYERSRSQQRAAAVVRDTAQKIEELLTHYRCAAKAQQEEHDLDVAAQKEQEKVEAERKEREARLEELRKSHEEQEALKLEARLKEEAAEAAERAKRDAKNAKELADRMAKLAEYQEAKKELEELEKAKAEQEAAMLALEAQRTQLYNRQRVEVRQAEYQQRVDDIKLKKLLIDEEHARKTEQLQKFREHIVDSMGIERDRERAIGRTVASENAATASHHPSYIPINEQASKHLGSGMHGFSDDQVRKHPMFRVHSALVASGLHRTAYARTLMMTAAQQHQHQASSAANPLSGAL